MVNAQVGVNATVQSTGASKENLRFLKMKLISELFKMTFWIMHIQEPDYLRSPEK